ncbi:MAG: gamma-glutamyl-gamma-aminobutyrate hydrolase family protein [Rhodospirillaceae bacterium]|nr:MAG: gamma-glutamyl-gamma-aminobutyrate hydrolase family protein [Rhodospirillaceae bacterium]
MAVAEGHPAQTAARGWPDGLRPSRQMPTIGVMTCARPKHEHTPEYLELAVGQKYLEPLLGRGALPLPIPNFGEQTPFDALMPLIDGLLLTGSLSNVHPDRYAGELKQASLPLDVHRDACTWTLLERCIAAEKPVFAICRGFQELNVFAGGSLDQMVHQVPGRHDHRAPASYAPTVKYGAWQQVEVISGGVLAQILGSDAPIHVNSLHLQGVDQVGAGLQVEARAGDGLVEAVSMPSAPALCLGVQWHPEAVPQDPVSVALFDAFVDACKPRG